MGFWDNLGNQNNDFNIQEFIKFYNQNKGKDMNSTLQNLLQSGKITQEQLNQATSQAKDIMAMLKRLGILK